MRPNSHRRSLLALGIGVPLSCLTFARQRPSRVSALEVSDRQASVELEEEVESIGTPKATIPSYWFQRPAKNRTEPDWAADAESADHRHLSGFPFDPERFALNASRLEQYARLCSYSLGDDRKVLFGLRGANLVTEAESTQFALEHVICEAKPDHIHLNCLLGVWDRDTRKIALFRGSTVPVVDQMQRQIDGISYCNMMPTGLHLYKVGAHKGPKQPGAFRQQQGLWVHRAERYLSYDLQNSGDKWDDLDGVLPSDNIHAGMCYPRSKPPFFNSAGCQVVAGTYAKGHPDGPWAAFRTAAGLHKIDKPGVATTIDDGAAFRYILATGRELRALAHDMESIVVSLRYGSSGDAVRKFQAVMVERNIVLGGSDLTSVFDRKTMGAAMRWQSLTHDRSTGIVSKDLGRTIGLEL